jgi:ubiquinone biosynthesis protein COQ4
MASMSAASSHAICRLSRAPEIAATVTVRRFSALNRPPPKYPGHVPLTKIEQAGMAIGSGIMSLFNPYRAGTPSFPIPCVFYFLLLVSSPL